jgi:hypothetical protein
MTAILKVKQIGRHRVRDFDDEPREEKPPLIEPQQRLKGLRLAKKHGRLMLEQSIELARLENEYAADVADALRIQKRLKLREEIANAARRRLEFEAAGAAFDAIKLAMENCADDEQLAVLRRKRADAFTQWDRCRNRLPEPTIGASKEERLVELASPATTARLRLARDAGLFWQNRLASLKDPVIAGTPQEIQQAEECLAAATLEYRLWRQRAIDE